MVKVELGNKSLEDTMPCLEVIHALLEEPLVGIGLEIGSLDGIKPC